MKGVRFVMDEKNRKTAVIIELKTIEQHQEDLEDFFDGILAESRKDEEKVPLDVVLSNLQNSGKLK